MPRPGIDPTFLSTNTRIGPRRRRELKLRSTPSQRRLRGCPPKLGNLREGATKATYGLLGEGRGTTRQDLEVLAL